MFILNRSCLLVLLAICCFACEKDKQPKEPFSTTPQANALVPMLEEVSGITHSKMYPGMLWAHEDSGNPAGLHLIAQDGTVVRSVFLEGTLNRDWEDIAMANNEIYLADIGDNAAAYSNYTIYQFFEPGPGADTLAVTNAITFTYPDGPHDAEAILVDSATKDIFIITKSGPFSRVYKLSYPYGANAVASFEGMLPFAGVVSAALSADGKEILVKTYTSIYYYQRSPGQSIAKALEGNYKNLKHTLEPQGEAICFALDGAGYYTLSEKAFASFVFLNFYSRQ